MEALRVSLQEATLADADEDAVLHAQLEELTSINVPSAATTTRSSQTRAATYGNEEVTSRAQSGGPDLPITNRGFYNPDNTCYVNAVMQVLMRCEPFRNVMRHPAVHDPALSGDIYPVLHFLYVKISVWLSASSAHNMGIVVFLENGFMVKCHRGRNCPSRWSISVTTCPNVIRNRFVVDTRKMPPSSSTGSLTHFPLKFDYVCPLS
jgi:hypothetical protein